MAKPDNPDKPDKPDKFAELRRMAEAGELREAGAGEPPSPSKPSKPKATKPRSPSKPTGAAGKHPMTRFRDSFAEPTGAAAKAKRGTAATGAAAKVRRGTAAMREAAEREAAEQVNPEALKATILAAAEASVSGVGESDLQRLLVIEDPRGKDASALTVAKQRALLTALSELNMEGVLIPHADDRPLRPQDEDDDGYVDDEEWVDHRGSLVNIWMDATFKTRAQAAACAEAQTKLAELQNGNGADREAHEKPAPQEPMKPRKPPKRVPPRERFYGLFAHGEECSACGEDFEAKERSGDFPALHDECVTDAVREFANEFTADGAALLDAIHEQVTRFVTFVHPHEGHAVAVGILHTYVFTHFSRTPYWLFTSPVKGSGKTTALKVFTDLAQRGHRFINPTPMAIARKIDATKPTLGIDEVDGIWQGTGKEAHLLRTILNAGYEFGMTVPRTANRKGTQGATQDFDIFCPKVMAGLSDVVMPPATLSRCVHVYMHLVKDSKREDYEVWHGAEFGPVKTWAVLWAAQQELKGVSAEPPNEGFGGGRDWNLWKPLAVVADAAGGEWPARVREAAIELTPEEDEDPKIVLLRDVRRIFKREHPTMRVTTESLIYGLASDNPMFWSDLTAKRLAMLLRGFYVKPTRWRDAELDAKNPIRGYEKKSFAWAWSNYLDGKPMNGKAPKR